MLMLGNKYFDVVDTDSERLMALHNPTFLYNMEQNQGFLHSCDIYPNDLATILKQNFMRALYPTDHVNVNPFCPICLAFVASNHPFLAYFSNIFGKTYLAHQECLKRQDSNCLNTILEEINHAKLSFISSVNEARSFCFGEKQFYVEMEVSHALTSKPFLTLRNKIQTNGTLLVWNFQKQHETSSCFPNIIAFPYPDFEIQISFSKLTEKEGKSKHKAFVNLQKMKLQGDKFVKISTQEFDLIVRVINDQSNKLKTVDQMNYKYRHSVNIRLPLIEMVKLRLKLPNNDSDQENQYGYSRQNSSITQLLNQNSPDTSSIRPTSFFERDEKRSAYQSQAASQRFFQKEKVDLMRLISSGKLSQYVKNNTQSRNFQSYLSQVTHADLNEILKTLSPQFCELVTHEYANYMMQKLFTLCNPMQRAFILDTLSSNIPMIVKNKQGTHTLQTLIALLTQEQEYYLVVQSIRKAIYELSQHANGTHFLQKIINTFPIKYTLPFFHFAGENLLAFSVNKNAMCVLKQMMKKMKDLQDLRSKDIDRSDLQDLKKRFINSVAMNIDRIIQDCYGNYVVQFCYEFFGCDKSARVTEMILERFAQFSVQKYSGNVVLKCVDTYWTNRETIERLKYSLSSNSILDMFRNKQGNKILLTIMERYEGTAVREKLYSQLMMSQPSKFLQDRWGIALGSRSGTVGTNWSSFSDAVKPSPTKKKKYYNIIQ